VVIGGLLFCIVNCNQVFSISFISCVWHHAVKSVAGIIVSSTSLFKSPPYHVYIHVYRNSGVYKMPVKACR